LSLATGLKRLGIESVIVLERDRQAGGVPRHCGHYPFGVREFHRLMKGPDYARRHVAAAEAAGVDIRTGVTVAALGDGARLSLSSHEGISELQASRVALCAGARESSRAQRMIGGSRPRGVISTGALQALVYLEGLKPFHRPVILGTELVSFSALLTCRHAGIRPAAMIEARDRITASAFAKALPFALGIPMILGADVKRILGCGVVEGVEIACAGGNTRVIEADGVICSGMFRPESALLQAGHLAVDPATGGPVIDQYGRASDPAYFCAGNLLRPIETSAWCAREGHETAQMIARDLSEQHSAPISTTEVRAVNEAIRYVLPQRLSESDAQAAMEHLQIRLNRRARGRLQLLTDGKEIWSKPIDSLPERRLLAPLAPLLRHRGAASIEVTLEES